MPEPGHKGRTALRGNVVLPDRTIQRGIVLIEGEKIEKVLSRKREVEEEGIEIIDYGDAYVSPGLIDLHLHGARGKDVMDGQVESLEAIASYQAECGVTGFLGSTISAPLESVLRAIRTIRDARKITLPSEILGVYIEGPFLSRGKAGMHEAAFIKHVAREDLERLSEAVGDMRCILSLAPEVEQNQRFIPELREIGMVAAIGHSNATYEEALLSFHRGVSHATHLFNAMRGFHHREPGVVGAVLDSDEVTAELIADGVHVHPAALRIALASKGPERLCLVTDSMKAAGKGDGIYRWERKKVKVEGRSATIDGTDILAGSVLTLNRAVKNMIEWTGVSVSQAVNMASLNPARILGLEGRIGSILAGKDANLAVFEQDFGVLDTFFRGKFVGRQRA